MKYGNVVCPVDTTVPAGALAIVNGRVIDPANGLDSTLCVAVDGGRVLAVAKDLPKGFVAQRTIDAAGMWVVPGLVDMHVHLREPGREDKETIATGTQAAAAGGITSVACMPNTSPVLDEESMIRHVIDRGSRCPCRVFPVGAITKNQAGEKLSPVGEMAAAGAVGISDDGRPVVDSTMMKNALNYSRSFGIPMLCHCEDLSLSEGGHMNESEASTRMGLRGIPRVSEEICVARDVMLAEYTGARVHICHVSTMGAVRVVRDAKKRGVNVTCETCPHYFVLTDADIGNYDTNRKMNPPLRTERDRQAVLDGLADGTIDAIATDHAPHTSEDKDVEFDAAAFGVIGLETSVGAVVTYLVNTGLLTPVQVIEKMSLNPARILGLPGGTLSTGAAADIAVIEPRATWTVAPDQFFSKSRNTPFAGMELSGAARWTVLDGRVVFERK